MKGRAVLIAMLAAACADANGPVTLDPASFTLDPASFTLTIGNKKQVAVLLGGQPLAPDPGLRPVWTTSDTAIVVVSGQGEVLAVGSGTATVTARLGRQSSWADVRVIPSAAGIWLGSVSDSFYTFALNEVTVGSDSTSSVTGTATVRDNRDSVTTFGVQGTNTSPNVSLRLSRQGHADATLTATFSSDTTLVGQLGGLGPTPQNLTLVRPTCYCPPLLIPATGPAGGNEGARCAAAVLCR